MEFNGPVLTTSNRVLRKNVGGNSTYANNLYKNLVKFGWKVNVVDLEAKNKIAYAFSESRIIRRRNSNIFHFPADTGALFKGRSPIVTTVHGNANRYESEIRKPISQRIWNERVKRSIAVSDSIITVSISSKIDICESFDVDEAKVFIAYHGIDHENFYPKIESQENSILSENFLYKWKIKESFALFVGNLEPRKNLDSLLRATLLPEWPSELKLVVVGNYAWGDKAILARLHENPKVIYLGPVDYLMLGELYRLATCFVFPSLYEGWGMPAAEAAASGCPVICSDRGALREATCGTAVYLKDPRDSREIAQAASRLFSNSKLRQSLSVRGVEMARSFTWENSAKKHIEIFENLL
jgi:glycosyltransferase involved in cell wall biosynthesis